MAGEVLSKARFDHHPPRKRLLSRGLDLIKVVDHKIPQRVLPEFVG